MPRVFSQLALLAPLGDLVEDNKLKATTLDRVL